MLPKPRQAVKRKRHIPCGQGAHMSLHCAQEPRHKSRGLQLCKDCGTPRQCFILWEWKVPEQLAPHSYAEGHKGIACIIGYRTCPPLRAHEGVQAAQPVQCIGCSASIHDPWLLHSSANVPPASRKPDAPNGLLMPDAGGHIQSTDCAGVGLV